MKQLVQLQTRYETIQSLDAEVLSVHREEGDGVAGLRKTAQKTKAKFPILLDPQSKHTARYSTQGFATYIIDKKGKVRKILDGTKTKRPTADPVIKTLKEIR
jgi:peroxiredoxin